MRMVKMASKGVAKVLDIQMSKGVGVVVLAGKTKQRHYPDFLLNRQ